MKNPTKVTCFVCDAKLYNWVPKSSTGKSVNIQPMEGLHFNTYGHYGSTLFDPMDGSSLDIVICDVCLAKHKYKLYGTGASSVKKEVSRSGKVV